MRTTRTRRDERSRGRRPRPADSCRHRTMRRDVGRAGGSADPPAAPVAAGAAGGYWGDQLFGAGGTTGTWSVSYTATMRTFWYRSSSAMVAPLGLYTSPSP